MNEQLLKMNGLSVEILDVLSFESHLGIPLKKNLHYFDKEKLIAELIAMTEWLDEQEILSCPREAGGSRKPSNTTCQRQTG